MESQLTKSRIEYIDLAKGFCILLVVVFHVFTYYEVKMPYNTQLQSFRMPLYFFLSGVFFKSYGGFFEFLKRKTNKLLFPFVFFYIFGSFIIPNLLGEIHKLHFYCIPLNNLPTGFWNESFQFAAIWFLWCLFILGILFYGIYYVSTFFKHNLYALLALSLLCGYLGILLSCQDINLPANLDSAMSALPFYAFGHVLYRKTSFFKPQKYDKWLPIIVAICFLFVRLFATDAVDFRKNLFVGNTWLTLYPCGIVGTLGVVLLAKWIRKLPIISFYGRYSIMILVTHEILFALFDKVICRFCHIPIKSALINILLLAAVYLVLIPFMKKYMPYVTAQKDIIKCNMTK